MRCLVRNPRQGSSALFGVSIPRKNPAIDVVFEEGPKRGVEVGADGNVTTPAMVSGDKFFQHLLLRGIFVIKHRARTQATLRRHHHKPSSGVAPPYGPIAEEIMDSRKR